MNNLNTREKGRIGEDIAVRFLVKQGFSILERNYLKKWGEIDIIAQKDSILHFVEVKSSAMPIGRRWGGGEASAWRPEENVHFQKSLRLKRAIRSYLMERSIDPDYEFAIHVASVTLDFAKRSGRVELLENVIL